MHATLEAEETRMALVARQAARLLDERGGFAILNEALRAKGFTLAAFIPTHDLHALMGEVYSDCPPCMEATYPSA